MKTSLPANCTLPICLFTLAWVASANADFVPVPLTSSSFNQDVVVEKGAPPPVVPVTTASMDTGIDNTGFAFCERGYNVDWPAIGLPAPDSILTLGVAMDHDCRFPPSYKTNNAVLIDSVLTTGTLRVTEPAACARLSFLVSGGNGGGTVGFTVQHRDGSTQAGTLVCPDWLDAAYAAYTTGGRINVTGFNIFDLNMNRPGLFLKDVDLVNTTSPVSHVDFAYRDGDGHNAIFAVSGAVAGGESFASFAVSGFNADLVVEATATRKGFLRSAPTATPDYGVVNGGNVWYEQGYYSPAPLSGLPAAGSVLTNASAPDHWYVLAPDFTANNAVVLDADSGGATITPITPPKSAVLSFLGAAGNGPATIGCQVHHADGSSETNWFVLSDWLNVPSAAFTVSGRVNIDFRTVDLVNASGLFASDITLTNTSSPVTSLDLSYAGGATSSHAVLFAISASSGSATPVRPVLSIIPSADGAIRIRTTSAGELQSTTSWLGSATVWRDEGPIVSELVVQPPSGENARFYRVLAR